MNERLFSISIFYKEGPRLRSLRNSSTIMLILAGTFISILYYYSVPESSVKIITPLRGMKCSHLLLLREFHSKVVLYK